ncbi:MAG TPA: lipid A biosynthesis acyltransferase [Bacteroidales bacterium]|nr:lipid A biosynthesis acyltransferase [Bacteroidales bacterium]
MIKVWHTISFYAFTVLTFPFKFMPLCWLYVISDLMYVFIYKIFRYRVDVVRQNLKRSFPQKTQKELKEIEHKFYSHFCDLFVEQFYILHANAPRAKRLCSFKNLEQLDRYYNENKSIVVAGGHYGNWELYGLFGLFLKHHVFGAYKPLGNKYFERFVNASRERFGALAVPMRDTPRTAMQFAKDGKLFFLGLIADQTPAKGEIRYWTTFLNQDTPVFLGTEKIARKLNQPVFFCNMRKIKRGFYEVELELLTENPAETQPYEITEMHVKALERLINEAPEYWLWSHRRWKHSHNLTQSTNEQH